jgi:Outer membrane protein
LVVSCKVGKDYQRPELDLPEKYRNETDANNDTSALSHNPRDFFKNKYLLKLIDNAFEKNSDLLLAVQSIALAESTLGTVKLNYLPEINAQINSRYTKSSQNSSSGQTGSTREIKDFNLSAGLTWSIDIWGKIKREKEEALANYLQSQEVRKVVQTKLVADIAKGYYNLLMLDEQLKIANRSKMLSDSTLAIMKIQYQVGDANILGIRQVEAQLNENKILISQIEQSIGLQEKCFECIMWRVCRNHHTEKRGE